MTDYRLLIKAYFDEPNHVVDWQRHGLVRLPDHIRPTHFGLDELPTRSEANAIENREQFDAFLNAHECGCFYGEGFSIDTSIFDNIPSEINVWSTIADARASEYGQPLFESWSEYGIVYGFGAAIAEQRARNGYEARLASGGTSEGWFGRDIRRYVPGLYWLNYFSEKYLDEHPLDVRAIAATLQGHVSPIGKGFLLKLYEQPDEWQAKADDVQRIVDQTAGVFSRTDVEVPQGLPVIEHLAWSERIFKQWP